MLEPTQTLPSQPVNEQFNVRQRLNQLTQWRTRYIEEDRRLQARAEQLNPQLRGDVQKGAQIATWRRRLRLQLVAEPIEISPHHLQHGGYHTLRDALRGQFAELSRAERRQWLTNLLFIMTPALRQLDNKIARVRTHLQFGQQRNFLLGGASGSGKTTYLDFLAFTYCPTVEAERNHVPIIKIDAPVSNHTPKPLLQRMVLACGHTYLVQDNEEELLMKLALYFQQCEVELLMVDEVEHLQRPEIRRRLLEVSNLTRGVPMVCASCHPQRLVDDDPEIAGRWNDYFELPQYTGDRLRQLLAFLDLLLPFPASSNLDLYTIPSNKPGKSTLDGPARLIEQYTGGILRDIMILIADTSVRAIECGETSLTPRLLEASWRDLQAQQITDFLQVFRGQRDGLL
jgi:hypothetical protein